MNEELKQSVEEALAGGENPLLQLIGAMQEKFSGLKTSLAGGANIQHVIDDANKTLSAFVKRISEFEYDAQQESADPHTQPLQSMAESAYMIEQHLKAVVYMERVKMSNGNMAFLPEVFNSIYTGEPFELEQGDGKTKDSGAGDATPKA